MQLKTDPSIDTDFISIDPKNAWVLNEKLNEQYEFFVFVELRCQVRGSVHSECISNHCCFSDCSLTFLQV